MVLTTHTLGRVQLPVKVRVVGSKGAPLEFPIDARSVGPNLLFSGPGVAVSEMGPSTSVSFERVVVLDTHTRLVQVRVCVLLY